MELERYYFTPSEIAERKDRVVALVLEYKRIETDKKAKTKELTDALKEMRAELDDLATHISEGFEMRAVQRQLSMGLDDDRTPQGKKRPQ